MRSTAIIMATVLTLAACAGRAPQPVQTAQAFDNNLSCQAIQAETITNNQKIADLGREKGQKTAQNVAAGVAGLFIWPLWFLMDFQGAPATETVALQNRNVHLAALAQEKCAKVASLSR